MAAVSPATFVPSAIFADKVPYVVTLLVAVFAWLVSYTVARYEKVPLIEYQVDQHSRAAPDPAPTRFIVTLVYISPAQAVACAQLRFRSRVMGSDADTMLTPEPMRVLSGPLIATSLLQKGKDLTLQVPLQPGTRLEVPMRAADAAHLGVFSEPCETEDGAPVSGLLPILKPESMETWVIRQSLTLLWVGALVWAAILLWLYWISWQRPTASRSNAVDKGARPLDRGIFP